MPTELVVEASEDGEQFRVIARLSHDVSDTEYGVFREDLVADVDRVRARYLRYHAANYGTIPDWHLGAGGEAFIFTDELLVELR